jgi:hypothetical protein
LDFPAQQIFNSQKAFASRASCWAATG